MPINLAGSLGYELPPNFAPETFDHWYTPADELTHAVDVSAFLSAKQAAMSAHASQATADGDDMIWRWRFLWCWLRGHDTVRCHTFGHG